MTETNVSTSLVHRYAETQSSVWGWAGRFAIPAGGRILPDWPGGALSFTISAMTRSELIDALAARFPQLTVQDANVAVKELLDAIAEALINGQRIEIRGFGSFSLNYRLPRTGRNPKTGEKVDVAAKYVPHFKPGKELRDRVYSAAATLEWFRKAA